MLDSIESAIEDIKNGKLIIVVDDEDRENEDDFIILYEKIVGKGSFGDLEEDEVPNSAKERLNILQQIVVIGSVIPKLE